MKTTKWITASLLMTLISSAAYAQEAAMNQGGGITDKGLAALGAFLGLGLAAFAGALGQAKAASAAYEGIARNPGAADKLFTPLILGLAFIESLVIYALVIALIKT
jgi:F-type H+-transporting ATPase subunit c